MSALRDDRLSPRPVDAGWQMPTDAAALLAQLARSPGLGPTDEARVRRFLTFPAARAMPESLQRELTERVRAQPRSDANTLYYGDNLDVLRRHVASESVDLVYLDPPFNS